MLPKIEWGEEVSQSGKRKEKSYDKTYMDQIDWVS
jgi:hypothetical protein